MTDNTVIQEDEQWRVIAGSDAWDINCVLIYRKGSDSVGHIYPLEGNKIFKAQLGAQELGNWFSLEEAIDIVKKHMA